MENSEAEEMSNQVVDPLKNFPLTRKKNEFYGTIKWLFLGGIYLIFFVLRLAFDALEDILILVSLLLLISLKFVPNTKIHREFINRDLLDEKELQQLSQLKSELDNGLVPPALQSKSSTLYQVIGICLIGFGYVMILGGAFIDPVFDFITLILLLILGFGPFIGGGVLINKHYDLDILVEYRYIAQQNATSQSKQYSPQTQGLNSSYVKPSQNNPQQDNQVQTSSNLTQVQHDRPRFCPECGTEADSDGRFCRECGQDLGSFQAETQQQSPSMQSTQANNQNYYNPNQQQMTQSKKTTLQDVDMPLSLIKGGAILLGLQNLLLLYFLNDVSNEESIERTLMGLETIWNFVFKIDIFAILIMTVGLFLIFNEKQDNRYLWPSIALGVWVLITFTWRVILLGNPFAGLNDVLKLITNFEDAMIFFFLASIILVAGGFLIWRARIGGGLIFFIFAIFNLLGTLLLRRLFNIEQLTSLEQLENRIASVMLVKFMLVPVVGIIAAIKMGFSSSLELQKLS